MKNMLRKYKAYIITLGVLVAYVILAFAIKLPCPIKHLTGIPCAGCGMSRAIVSALTLDFSGAFEYHPLWILVPPAALAFAILGANRMKKASFILACALAVLLLAVLAVRIALGDPVVAIEPDKGAIYRFFVGIFGK